MTEVLPLDKLHRQIELIIYAPRLVDIHDVGMTHRYGEPAFVSKARGKIGTASPAVGQHGLQSTEFPGTRRPVGHRDVDRPHTAFGDLIQ